MDDLSRRDVLSAISTFGVAALLPGVLPGCGSGPSDAPADLPPGTSPVTTVITKRKSDLIRDENEKPGSPDWLLTKPAIDHDVKYRCPWIEGYFSRTSVRAGETLSLHVSTNPESKFTVDLYRMGYYAGAGARRVATLGSFPGKAQEDPLVDPHRLRICNWEPCTKITIPADWLSGIYLGKLTAEREGVQSYVIFIVRDNRRADFMFQCCDNTWQAYNRWPGQYSLYDNGGEYLVLGPGMEVSFDRPYGKYCQILDQPLSTGSGEWLLWEFPLAYWMEQQGYDVTYISNLDTARRSGGAQAGQGLPLGGPRRILQPADVQPPQAAIAEGLNVAFLSGNTCCGVTSCPRQTGRPTASSAGRTATAESDEVARRLPDMADAARSRRRTRSTLIGARSTGPVMGGGDWICVKPEHWLFAGTGMKKGDGIPGLVGWECHGDPAEIPGLEMVAEGPETTCAAGKGHYTATVYPGPKGNVVFNAATCWWADGLSAPPATSTPRPIPPSPRGPIPACRRSRPTSSSE